MTDLMIEEWKRSQVELELKRLQELYDNVVVELIQTAQELEQIKKES